MTPVDDGGVQVLVSEGMGWPRSKIFRVEKPRPPDRFQPMVRVFLLLGLPALFQCGWLIHTNSEPTSTFELGTLLSLGLLVAASGLAVVFPGVARYLLQAFFCAAALGLGVWVFVSAHPSVGIGLRLGLAVFVGILPLVLRRMIMNRGD